MSLFVDQKTGRLAPARAWFPGVALIGMGVGAVAIGLNHLLIPSSVQHDTVALLAGRDYADVQLAAFDSKPLLIHSHAAMGVLFVGLAALQYWRKFRNQNLKRHRWIGYVAGACLLLLPVTAVAATFVYPFSGMAAVWPNLLWMTLITWFVVSAWRAIRRKDMRGHETWITRATGMTLGITLSRLYQPLLVLGFHMDTHLALILIFWLGQGEGLLLAEMWLRRPGGVLAPRPQRHPRAA